MPPSRSTGPDATRRSQASRRAILDAAFALVGEVGYGKLSIEGIAARAGVGKQTIYRWWPSKGAVLFDAFLTLAEQDAEADPALPDTGDLEADLVLVLRTTADEFADPRFDAPMRALSAEISTDPDLAEHYAQRLDRPMRELKKKRLRSAQQAGQLPPGTDLDLAVDLIWGVLRTTWLERTRPITPDYAERIVRTALHGLAAAPPPDSTD